MWIADGACNIVRLVTHDTHIITTVVGNGVNAGTGYGGFSGDGGAATAASLWGPFGIAFDPFGRLFIADYVSATLGVRGGSRTEVVAAARAPVL